MTIDDAISHMQAVKEKFGNVQVGYLRPRNRGKYLQCLFPQIVSAGGIPNAEGQSMPVCLFIDPDCRPPEEANTNEPKPKEKSKLILMPQGLVKG